LAGAVHPSIYGVEEDKVLETADNEFDEAGWVPEIRDE